jgi:hypothetical protein
LIPISRKSGALYLFAGLLNNPSNPEIALFLFYIFLTYRIKSVLTYTIIIQ